MKIKSCFLLLLLIPTHSHGMNNNHSWQNEWLSTTAIIVDYVKKHPLLLLISISMFGIGAYAYRTIYSNNNTPEKSIPTPEKSISLDPKNKALAESFTTSEIFKTLPKELKYTIIQFYGSLENSGRDYILYEKLNKEFTYYIQSLYNDQISNNLIKKPYPMILRKTKFSHDKQHGRYSYYHVYNVLTGEPILFNGNNDWEYGCSFFNKQNKLFVLLDDHIQIYDITKNSLENHRYKIDDNRTRMSTHPHDNHIFVLSDTITILSLLDQQCIKLPKRDGQTPIKITFNKNDDLIAVSYRQDDDDNNHLRYYQKEGTIVLYKFNSDDTLEELASQKTARPCRRLKFNHARTHIIGFDNQLGYFYFNKIMHHNNKYTLNSVAIQTPIIDNFYDCKYQNRCFLLSSFPKPIAYYDYTKEEVTTSHCLNDIITDSKYHSVYSTISKNKQYFGALDRSTSTLYVADIKNNKSFTQKFNDPMVNIDFHPNSSIISAASTKGVHIYNVTGKHIATINHDTPKQEDQSYAFFTPNNNGITVGGNIYNNLYPDIKPITYK
jgi:hypothetical protein